MTAFAAVSSSLGLRLGWGARLTTQGLRRHLGALLVTAFAFALAAAALAICIASAGTGAARAVTSGTAQLVAFLDDALPAAERDELAATLGRLPGVAGVRVLPSDEALGRMRAELGDRAAVLDGVEEGFLPTTLEISLRPGRQGVGRADELAWRLRRTGGISDVDVLRSEADHRLVEEQETSRRLRITVMILGGAVALVALLLAAGVLRLRRADASVFAGLGFTPFAVHGPAFVAGALAAFTGTAIIVAAIHATSRGVPPSLASPSAPLAAALLRSLSEWRGQLAALAALTLLGGVLGWWGTRLPRRKGDQLAPWV